VDELLVNNEQSCDSRKLQKKVLWAVLAINFVFFIGEMTAGLFSGSMGLVADSLDMLADSLVYALALIAVGGSVLLQKRIASFAGYFQVTLAVIGFIEVIRRFVGLEQMPDFKMMVFVSLLALIANAFCLYLLQKNKSSEAHIQASMIFTSNDIIINIGVIFAAILVKWTNSPIPDLFVGTIVFFIVARGAQRILKLGRK
jgi:Co/Zn/Cd efflux system component